MGKFISFIISLAALSMVTLGASLRTLDGKAYEGEIRLDRGGFFLVVPKVGSLVKVEPMNVLDATFGNAAPPSPETGVAMIDGTVLAAAAIDGITADVVNLRRTDGKPLTLPITRIARVLFHRATPEQLAKIPSGAVGLLLSNGDFYEGQLRGLDGRSLKMESVLFGIASFDVGDKVLALILHDAKTAVGNVIVRTVDGSILSGDGFAVEGATVKMNAATVGPVVINGKDLVEIQSSGGRMVSMLDLQRGKVEGGDPKLVFAVDGTTIGLPAKLLGEETHHAMALAGGASVSFDLNGQYALFICRAGLPMNALPAAHARFKIEVDGKPVFQSADRTSLDDALNIGVKVSGGRTLTLKVETGLALPVNGLWCDPELIKVDAGK